MNTGCKNDAHTLRLFHTFALFEKKSKNRCEKGCRKSYLVTKNGAVAAEGSIYSPILAVFRWVEKSMFLLMTSWDVKKSKKRFAIV